MRIGPDPLLPLNPIRPDRSVHYPKALGAEFVGNPLLKFPEVEIKPSEALQARAKEVAEARTKDKGDATQAVEPKQTEGLSARGALAQLPAPRSTAEPSGPLGSRVDLLT